MSKTPLPHRPRKTLCELVISEPALHPFLSSPLLYTASAFLPITSPYSCLCEDMPAAPAQQPEHTS